MLGGIDVRSFGIFIMEDIYKHNLRKRIYLQIFFLKIPLLLKRYSDTCIRYRLLFFLPIMKKYDKDSLGKKYLSAKAHKHYAAICQRIQKDSLERVGGGREAY